MSQTLFWYVFRDLLRIFFLAAGTLAGIMSFGGLLRPLTEHGLDAGQVGKMLTFFTPAMTTYSFPVAALFATSMVYGRLGADNELTACRATGISYLSLTMPALVLGLLVAIVSLVSLCFIVPRFTLKVEQVVYSNLAQLIENKIARNHELEFDTFNVFAQSAEVLPPDAHQPGEQRVKLIAPIIINYSQVDDPEDPTRKLKVPATYMMGSQADIILRPMGPFVQFSAVVENGTRFMRELNGSSQVGTAVAEFAPVKINSPIREDTKFMTIEELKNLYNAPENSQRLIDEVHRLICDEQRLTYLTGMMTALNKQGEFQFEAPDGELYVLHRSNQPAGTNRDNVLVLQSAGAPDERQVKLERRTRDGDSVVQLAREIRVNIEPEFLQPDVLAADKTLKDNPRLVITLEGYDVQTRDPVNDRQSVSLRQWQREINLPMPADLSAMRAHRIEHFRDNKYPWSSSTQRDALQKDEHRVLSKITGEIHGRAALSVSCLTLVMIGCGLGMMFRSGNFLSAFAVSFIPAMLCIALVVTGQQVCARATGSIAMGLSFIWAGNVIVAILTGIFLVKLQRQ